MKITKTYETVPLSKLVPYARNAREHNAKQVAQIRASFREFGTLNPCLVDEDYTLIAGHGRLLAVIFASASSAPGPSSRWILDSFFSARSWKAGPAAHLRHVTVILMRNTTFPFGLGLGLFHYNILL
ncbi:MAG: ParB N-terminal domain-containing protein [Firmicutes bacterium]|nr:ParB N-terminal domain-containing protein [Bacillota bacterium]